MPNFWILPIEPLEERYSAQWLKWVQEVDYGDNTVYIIDPKTYVAIQHGSFLDVVGTNVYKNEQMRRLLLSIQNKEVKDGDIVFVMDAWYPGIEMLAYIRDGLKFDIKIYGMLHAGCYDPHDFLTKSGMGEWGLEFERSFMSIYDTIFVSTKWHKKLIQASHPWYTDNIQVIPFPIKPYDFVQTDNKLWHDREKIVVFPHRLDDEKQPWLFDKLKEQLGPSWNCIKTKEVCKTKKEYYDLLHRAMFSVSFAKQETWGIAMLESMFCGAVPIVPNCLSYKEIYPKCCQYEQGTSPMGLINEWHSLSGAIASSLWRVHLALAKALHKRLGECSLQKMVQHMVGTVYEL